ncbi:unnamed protein product [Paramecium pentaurelia]|uniref:Uncharacterized protein n=1 Tax=Paramecium pentaurelia TaxID=43138 RepID=A0A8S1W3K9_9CILI|nr:unnamed protein product [Paramecium pentaurelia]
MQLTLHKQQQYYSIDYILINNNTQIYLNTNDNYLFTFNTQIIVYELKIPQLQINLTDSQVQRITYDITIYAKLYNLTFTSIYKMFISIKIVNQNDKNIYVIFNKNFPQYQQISDDEKNEQIFVGYSGKLLQYTVNTDNKQFGCYNQTTYEDGLVKIKSIIQLGLIIQRLWERKENSYKTLIDTNISIQDQQLQVAYILKDHNLIIGVSDDYTIQLHIQSSYDKSLYFSSEFRFEQQFQQFLITFNNLITLIINPEFKS